MAINKNDFKNAFREVVSSEFAHIPTDENSIDFTFSERFNKRMAKLIKSQKKAYYSLINTAYKRVAIICIIILALLTTACSVKVIREPIVNFIKQVYESFTHYSYDGDTTDKITKEYYITAPDGFNQTNITNNDFLITTEYTNNNGDIIEYNQMTTEYSTGYFVDNENGNIKTEFFKGIEIQFKERYDTKSAIWTQNGYVFVLDCYGNVSFDTIKQMIVSLK